MTHQPSPAESSAPNGHPPRLSVAMIVRDEADTIARALESVKAVADEIVVVDTGSTDETVSIAEAAGATVHYWPWADDFAAARNVAISHCHGRWILSLDADEALDAGSGAALIALIEQAGDALVGYQLRLINWRDEDGREASEHLALRLFPRHPALRFHGRIHETLQADAGTGLERCVAPELVLHHFGYQREGRRFPAKLARNLAMLERSVQEAPDDTYLRYHWGVALQIAGRIDEALSCYQEVIVRCAGAGREPEYLPYAMIYGMAACIADGRLAEALDWAKAGVGICVDEPDYWLNVGIAHSGLGQYDKAIDAYQHCLRLGDAPRLARIMDRGATSWKPLVGIGAAYQALGDLERTEQYLRQAIVVHPGHIDSLQTLIQLALNRQDHLRAEMLMRQLVNACQGEARWHVLQELGRFLISQRRFNALIDLLPRALVEPPSDMRHRHLIVLAGMLQDAGLDYAVDAFLRRDRLEPDVAEILAARLIASGDWEALRTLCDELIAAEVRLPFAHTQRGLIRLRQGDDAGGLGDLQRAIELAPDDASAWCHRGMAHLDGGRLDEAESDLQRAILIDDHLPARLGLVSLALARGEADTAAQSLARLLSDCPADQTKRYAGPLADLMRRCERWFDACFAGGSDLDPMALSRMIDQLGAHLQAVGHRR